MYTVNNMAALRGLLADSKPGDVISVKGYIDTKGKEADLTVARLDPTGYRTIKLASLAKLERRVEAEPGDTEAAAMHSALEENLFGAPKGEFKDVFRDAGGFHVHKDAGTLEEVYLLRVVDIQPEPSYVAPKTAAALSRHLVALHCKLPSLRYIHTLKFCAGKFTTVTLTRAAELSPEQRDLVAIATGADERVETNETSVDVSDSAQGPA